jgi:hypothetical protein
MLSTSGDAIESIQICPNLPKIISLRNFEIPLKIDILVLYVEEAPKYVHDL